MCTFFMPGNIISIYILRNRHIRLNLHPGFTNLCICLVNIFVHLYMLQNKTIMHRQYLHLLYNFQAVFDSLFLIFSNSIFAVSALIWPHQVQQDYEVFMGIMRATLIFGRDQFICKLLKASTEADF